MAGDNGGGIRGFVGKFFAAAFQKFVVVENAVAGQAIDPVQFKFVGKRWTRHETLEPGHAHILDILEDHVVLNHCYGGFEFPRWKIAAAA